MKKKPKTLLKCTQATYIDLCQVLRLPRTPDMSIEVRGPPGGR